MCILLFAQHSAECARGMSILDGRRLGRTKDWCERQDRFGLDLHINREGVAVQGGFGGGRGNSEFPSYCARKLAGHMREILLSGPGSAGCLVSRSDIPSVIRPAMSIFHNDL